MDAAPDDRRFTAVVNPTAGAGRAVARWRSVADALARRGADVRAVPTCSRDHSIEVAGKAAAEGRVVIAVGGDGMVRDVASGIVAGGGGTLAIVPAGRGNDLAGVLGYPRDTAALVRLLTRGEARRVDVIDAGGVIVPGNVYAGIDAAANDVINRWRRLPDLLLYRIAPLRAIAGWRPAEYTLTLDAVPRTVRAHTVVIANSGSYGHGLRIVPPARLDDGLLQVLVVGDLPRHEIIRFLHQATHGRHLTRPEVTAYTAREVTVAADRPLCAYADGDPLAQLPITVRIRPAALRLLSAPAG